MDRTITTKLVTAVLAIFLLLTIAGQLFAGSEHSYKTEVALKYDSQDTIEFTACLHETSIPSAVR